MERLAPPLPLLGIILAGGKSSRMGRDKALLEWNGRPLLCHSYHCAAEVCSQVYVMTPRLSTYAPLLPDACILIPERGENQGPLRAFQAAIDFIAPDPSTWMLLLACDLPQLRAAVLGEWFQRIVLATRDRESLAKGEPLPLAYVPRNPEGWWEPLCGFYQARCRSSLDRFLQQGGRSFQHWLNQETVEALPLDDPEMLLNLNSLDGLSPSHLNV